MAPSMPTGFIVQQGNGQVYVSWDLVAGATTYNVYRSLDNVTFAVVASPAANSYLDTAVTVGTQYWYKVSASNGAESNITSSIGAVPTIAGTMSLGELRLQAQQRADMVNSNFLSVSEWNNNISNSVQELYDLITTVYEDYYLAVPITFVTDGSSQYALPNGINYSKALPFYKLAGVDLGLTNNNNAKVTVQKFQFIQRNRYIYPNVTSTFLGVFNMRYRIMGNNLMFIPTPSSGQYITLWYIPRAAKLLADTDIVDGINGWLEYIICDAAIKALQKEESDISVLAAEKLALIKRIEDSAQNRDVGEPETISQTRRWGNGDGGPGFDGGFGGY